jgi:hypothetical protein
MRLELIAVIVLTGPVSAIAVTQPIVVTPKTDLFNGLDPDSRVIAFLEAPESPNQSGSCSPASSEASLPERSDWLDSVFGWIEAHVLRVETALASGIECDTGCSGHYQGPEHILGCGLYGGCGSYCASDPTQFYWEDGCIDCTINDPDSDCDGCSVDQLCAHPPAGGPDSNPGEGSSPGAEIP